VDRFGKFPGFTQIRLGRFTPEHISVWRIRQSTIYRLIDSRVHIVKTIGGLFAGQKFMIRLPQGARQLIY